MTNGNGDLEAFGYFLRKQRQRAHLSLRQVEYVSQRRVTRNVLSNAERGVRLISEEVAAALDDAYKTSDSISRYRLDVSSRLPTPSLGSDFSDQMPRNRWLHNFPAQYSGEVWIQVVPMTESTEVTEVELSWGPWHNHLKLRDNNAVTIAFTKGDDGLSIPLIVETNRPVVVVFSVGPPPGSAIDLNAGWRRPEDD